MKSFIIIILPDFVFAFILLSMLLIIHEIITIAIRVWCLLYCITNPNFCVYVRYFCLVLIKTPFPCNHPAAYLSLIHFLLVSSCLLIILFDFSLCVAFYIRSSSVSCMCSISNELLLFSILFISVSFKLAFLRFVHYTYTLLCYLCNPFYTTHINLIG